MKRVMFLLDYYSPNASPNGVCVEKVAKCFVRNGWEVAIVCFKNPQEPQEEEKNGIKIYRVCDPGNPHKNTKIDAVKFYSRWLLPSKHPITERKQVTQQLYEGAEQILSMKEYNTVVCVHLPVETLIAGVYIKEKHPEITVVSYMLDSLSGGFIPRFLPNQFARKRKLTWENNIFKRFDRVVLMKSSKAHHEKYLSMEEWYDKAVYLDIPLLEENPVSSERHKSEAETLTITFCGLLNDPYRQVKHFLQIAQKCKEYRFIFAGSSNIETELREIQNEKGSNIVYLGQVQHSTVEELLIKSDVLLNLGVTVPSAISGKIFEYMSYGKPIISTYSIDDEACIPYLRKYKLGLLIDERSGTVAQQAEQLSAFVEKTKNQRADFNSVERIFYLNTPQAFVDYLSKVNKLNDVQ